MRRRERELEKCRRNFGKNVRRNKRRIGKRKREEERCKYCRAVGGWVKRKRRKLMKIQKRVGGISGKRWIKKNKDGEKRKKRRQKRKGCILGLKKRIRKKENRQPVRLRSTNAYCIECIQPPPCLSVP